MFRNLEINYFKCFERLMVDWKKLNIISGENSTGKSTMIQAILLLAQAQEYALGNVLNGKYEQLGQVTDIRNIYKRGKISIRAEWDNDKKSSMLEYDDVNETWRIDIAGKMDIIYLSAERIGVQNEYHINTQELYRIGVRGEYAFDFLSKNKHENLREEKFAIREAGLNLGNQVDYWLNYIAGYTVQAEAIDGTTIVKVAYREKDSVKDLRPCHVGIGVSYLAGVIIAALSCTRDSLFIVENPEIHLHPGAQSRFVEFFAFLASKGLQVIMETHSDHIINGVRKAIKRNNIASQETAIYFMKKNEENISEAVSMRISEKGVIINQEKGFFDQFDNDLDVLLGFDEYE